ncbi:BON domain-containing protein [Parendozoicomonas sp. Alg238-R29]|uniref:BON domain-containing protein n=1 Tax=Parendozoicomonas sp. Alg238-R29 TaxID=2993446 RepID=UPI00248DEB94|nr:BON domain-containing protein [Parendozoicomonas sp. Alg238-R29]
MKALLPILAISLSLITGCTATISAINEGPIQENPGSRSFGAWIDDQSIETVTSVNIEKSNPDFKNNHVVVVSFNGYVLLTGQTATPELKAQAERVAKQTLKVRKVYNELEIAGPTTRLTRSSDSWITSKIKGRMISTSGFPSSRVKVITENGAVYLMGLVTPEEAQQAVNLARESYGVQKIVKVFEYIR